MWWAEVIGLLIRPSSMDESSNKNLISILSKSDFDNDFDNLDVVAGYRENRKDNLLRTIYSKIANIIIRFITNSKSLDLLTLKDEEAASDWLNLAAISQRDKNFEEALMFARKALDSQPDLSLAYKVAGEVLFALNRREEAERMLMLGVILGEDDDNSVSNLACIAAIKGNGKLAFTLYNRVLVNSPEHQSSIKNLEHLKKEVSSGRYKFQSII